MNYSSESEGEIVESKEKATTALPSTKNISVNRRLREALSRSPSPGLRGSKNNLGSRRERSRSPYRASRGQTWEQTRGEKRRRDDQTNYGRDSKRRSDGNRDDRHDQVDTDRNRTKQYPERYGEGRGREGYGDKRLRTRSPSPRRHAFDRSERRRRDASEEYSARDNRNNHAKHNHARGDTGRFNDNAVSQRADPAHTSSKETESNGASPEQNHRVRFVDAETSRQVRSSASDATMTLTVSSRILPQTSRETEAHASGVTTTAPNVIDEAAAIEERRKRREAIKAKYKGQAAPLLVQALHTANPPASPSAEEIGSVRSARSGKNLRDCHANAPNLVTPESPVASSPRTPRTDSVAGSPEALSVTSDTDLANLTAAAASPQDTDGPSAADYDPSMDMQEDRFRGEKTHETSAQSYDETKTNDQVVLLPKSAVEGLSKTIEPAAGGGGDDMFASDDEDDMFAPAKPEQAAVNGEPSKAVPIPEAKELDMNLLDNWDDHEGYYRVILGELLDGRYHVQANLGRGMFSGVVRATDTKTDRLVAIKIIRNNETMTKAGNKEIQILEKLAEADPEDKKHVIRLERSFVHKNHLCMVFENLSINLREVLKKFGRDVGINIKAVRSYAQQMFLGLSLLRKCNILHADLKPDNVLVNEARNMLKICDLGSAADASENDITPYLVSRFYRAPEIILGIPYDFAIDMWSTGCTLFELYTGKILFTGRTNNQMLRSIMECRGKFSLKMLKKAEFGAVHFDEVDLTFRSVERDKLTGKDVTRLINFVKPTRDLKSRLMAAGGGKKMSEADVKELNLFVDLLERCLSLNPERRMTPAEALKHPFIHRPSSVSAIGSK